LQPPNYAFENKNWSRIRRRKKIITISQNFQSNQTITTTTWFNSHYRE